MNGYRVTLGSLSHAEWADRWQRSYQSACELMAGPIGDTEQMRKIKQCSLSLMARHAVENDRESL